MMSFSGLDHPNGELPIVKGELTDCYCFNLPSCLIYKRNQNQKVTEGHEKVKERAQFGPILNFPPKTCLSVSLTHPS